MLGIVIAFLMPVIVFLAHASYSWHETGTPRFSEALRLVSYQLGFSAISALLMLPVLRAASQDGLVPDLASMIGLYAAGSGLLVALVIAAAWHTRQKIGS